MINGPFSPEQTLATFAPLAQLSLVLAGFAVIFAAHNLAKRLFLVGIFLAFVAGIVPGWTQ